MFAPVGRKLANNKNQRNTSRRIYPALRIPSPIPFQKKRGMFAPVGRKLANNKNQHNTSRRIYPALRIPPIPFQKKRVMFAPVGRKLHFVIFSKKAGFFSQKKDRAFRKKQALFFFIGRKCSGHAATLPLMQYVRNVSRIVNIFA